MRPWDMEAWCTLGAYFALVFTIVMLIVVLSYGC
jgi:hypothetical protein